MSDAKPKSSDLDELSFEQAMSELETIVRELENGQIELEQSIEVYSRGTQLKQHCEKKLADAKLKVEKIMVEQGQVVGAEPLDNEAS